MAEINSDNNGIITAGKYTPIPREIRTIIPKPEPGTGLYTGREEKSFVLTDREEMPQEPKTEGILPEPKTREEKDRQIILQQAREIDRLNTELRQARNVIDAYGRVKESNAMWNNPRIKKLSELDQVQVTSDQPQRRETMPDRKTQFRTELKNLITNPMSTLQDAQKIFSSFSELTTDQGIPVLSMFTEGKAGQVSRVSNFDIKDVPLNLRSWLTEQLLKEGSDGKDHPEDTYRDNCVNLLGKDSVDINSMLVIASVAQRLTKDTTTFSEIAGRWDMNEIIGFLRRLAANKEGFRDRFKNELTIHPKALADEFQTFSVFPQILRDKIKTTLNVISS